MDIAERAQALAVKIGKYKAGIETEEATKNAFVMPFIGTVLGYDVFNPAEVVPEFTADVSVKRGEKIDYAIMHDGQVQILIEVKKIKEPLCPEHIAQLYRYFSVTNARIAILTNGEVYEFYTDLDAPNLMDAKPFLVFNFSNIDDTLLPELGKLAKGSFDLDSVLSAAGELKSIGQIKRALAAQFKQPGTAWIKLLASSLYEGNFTQNVREQFAPLVEKAGRQFLNDQVNDRLKNALADSEPAVDETETEPGDQKTVQPSEIVTTEDELDGYRIVRAIVCSEVAASRVVSRDNKSYFGILLDDNNRKPIARLWFNNRAHWYLGVFDEHKIETRMPITAVEDIYQHADQLRKTVSHYLTKSDVPRVVVTMTSEADPGCSGVTVPYNSSQY